MILLMGIAGSGKGTQGKLLADKDGYHVISTGELLRTHGSKEQHVRMLKGEILRDDEVTALLDTELSKIIDQNNVILDGYPRRKSQAEWLLLQQKGGRFKIDCVIHLVASKDSVKTRLNERARLDDHEAGIEQRFKEFELDTVPILNHFIESGIKVKEVKAELPVEVVHAEIVEILKDLLKINK